MKNTGKRVFLVFVSPERDSRGDAGGESDTPPTRSYIDALLQGNLSESELANLRSEIGRAETKEVEESDDDDEHEVRTRLHSYSAEERQSSRPSGQMAQVDVDDDAPTLFRHSSIPAARPPSQAPRAVTMGGDPHPPARPASYHPAPHSAPSQAYARPLSQPAPSSRPRAAPISQRHMPPSSRPRVAPGSYSSVPPSSRPVVDIGDMLSDDFPAPPANPQLVLDEVPLSVPSLRGFQQQAIDQTYLDAIGGPNGVPRLAVSPGELRCLPLGAAAGFLVSCIDGVCTVDDLIDISGLSRLDTLRILYDLVQHGAVEVGAR